MVVAPLVHDGTSYGGLGAFSRRQDAFVEPDRALVRALADHAAASIANMMLIDRLASYTVPIGSAFSVLGLIWGGILFMAGDARAGRVLGLVALGLGVVLLSKPIAA